MKHFETMPLPRDGGAAWSNAAETLRIGVWAGLGMALEIGSG
jgi:hypothetical protein